MAPLSGRTRVAGLIALMAFAMFSLTQCRMVGDRLTGVDSETLHNSPVTQCLVQCNITAAKALIDETRLFLANLKACNNSQSCIAAEKARHEAAVKKIATDLKACLNGCHHQGGGGS